MTIRGDTLEGASTPLQARVTLNGALMLSTDVISIDWIAWYLSDLTTPIDNGNLTGAISDTLQPWPVDGLGYNFEHIAAGSLFDKGCDTVRIEHTVNLTAGGTLPLSPYEVFVKDLATDGVING